MLKSLRSFEPFNHTATSLLRAGSSAFGVQSEFLVRKLRRVGNVEVPLPNGSVLRFWTKDDDLIPNQVYWHGWNGVEPETTSLFFRLASRARVTFDLGAHIGIFSLLAGHANRDGHVYAFEPMPAIFRRLELNIGLNRLSNVDCVAAAVGEVEGVSEFFYSTGIGLPAESSMRKEVTEAFLKFSTVGEIRKTTVPVTTIDKFVQEREIDKIDLIKLDTEGTEPSVLRGMVRTIDRDRPNMICEVLKGFGTEEELDEVLRPFGYRYYLLTSAGPVERTGIEGQPDGHWELRNYLFTTSSQEDLSALI